MYYLIRSLLLSDTKGKVPVASKKNKIPKL